MKRGETFDLAVVTRELKLYPVDVVDAATEVSDGPKRLYSQLFKIAVTIDRRKTPWQGYVFASEKFLAKRLGKSEQSIRRDLAELRKLSLVRVERPNKTENNRYYFLWKPDFGLSNVSGQDVQQAEDDLSNVTAGDRSHPTACIRSDLSNLTGHDLSNVSGLYKEKQIVVANTEGSASASTGGFSKFQEAYPEPKRKIKVDSACRAYVSVIDGKPGEYERLIAGVERWKASTQWQSSLLQDGGRFIPHMDKFIFERRYLDYPPAADETPESCAATPIPAGKWDPATEQFIA